MITMDAHVLAACHACAHAPGLDRLYLSSKAFRPADADSDPGLCTMHICMLDCDFGLHASGLRETSLAPTAVVRRPICMAGLHFRWLSEQISACAGGKSLPVRAMGTRCGCQGAKKTWAPMHGLCLDRVISRPPERRIFYLQLSPSAQPVCTVPTRRPAI